MSDPDSSNGRAFGRNAEVGGPYPPRAETYFVI